MDPAASAPKRFFASPSIDGAQPGTALKVSDIFAEVITHRAKHPGNKVPLSLNIEASSEPGYDETIHARELIKAAVMKKQDQP